jgi:uncharacterized protein YgbK (DUF1537 family)
MIAVIADDFTGAAELAGIALRYGLTISLSLDVNTINQPNTDVIILSTDSRSLVKKDAIDLTKKAVENILKLKPTFIYKKIDSVLRGYVIDELKVQMMLCGLQKAIIAPANPSLGRTISSGKYFINNQEITTTDFVNDFEFPIKSAYITEILHQVPVKVLGHTDALPVSGFVVAQASKQEDVMAWASKVDISFALAGAGDFFTALLQKQYQQLETTVITLQQPFLYICGSAFKTATDRIKALKQQCLYVKKLNKYFSLLKLTNEYFVLAIDEDDIDISAKELRQAMAIIAKQVIIEKNIKELFIEGGSTAANILSKLNITSLQPVNEISRGVVRMNTDNLFITVKPGSYILPDIIERLHTT